MKTNKLFLMGMAAIGMVACTSEDDLNVNGKSDVSTYAGLTITIDAPQTRADGVTQAQSDNVGRDAENTIESVTLSSSLSSAYWGQFNASKPNTPTGNDFWKDGSNTYTVAAFAASAGAQRMAIALNHQSDANANIEITTTTVGKSWNSETDNAVTDIEKLTREGKFVMTSKRGDYTVIDNVTEDVVNAATSADASKNVFAFDVERVVSQAIVAKSSGLAATTTKTTNSRVNVDLDNLTYAVINGATTLNFWLDEAGDRTITDVSGTYKYKDFHSAIHNYLGEASDDWNNAKTQSRNSAHLVRLGNYAPFSATALNTTKAERTAERDTENAKLGGYAPIPVFASAQMSNGAAPVVSSRGIYFLENSVGSNAYTTDNKNVGFYRLAYAKVYGEVTPVAVYGEEWVADGTDDVKQSWNVIPYEIKTQAEYDAMPETTQAEKLAKKHVYVKGTTFYRGALDDFIYANARGAMIGYVAHNTWDPSVAGDKAAKAQAYYKYLDARCAWRALLNRQTGTDDADDITKAVQSANTRRNNIYLLEIGEFQQIGMPYDPSDPSDPNLPKPDPDDPDDPEGDEPDEPDIEIQHTYMKVISHVLPWNVVKRTAVFY